MRANKSEGNEQGMKKKYIIAIILLVMVIVAVATYFIYTNIVKEGRKYEIEQIENFNYLVLKQGESYGVIDRSGNLIINAEYTNVIIPNPEKPVFICINQDDTVVKNNKNENILTQFQNVNAIRLKNIAGSLMYEKSVLTFEKDGKVGLINLEGKEIAKPEYESIEALPYKEGELLVKQNNKFGVINIKGNELVKPEFDKITVDGYFVDNEGYKYAGYIVSNTTENGYRYGYVDLNGKLIIETEYNDLSRIANIKKNEEIYLLVAKDGRYGVLKNGIQLINNDYQSIQYDETNNVYVVEKSKKYGALSSEGKEIIPVQYNEIDITGMFIYATTADKTEVFDREGNLTNWDSNISILQTENENYNIEIDNTQGTVYYIIDKNNNQLTKQPYTYIEYFNEDNFIASLGNNKLGIINSKEEPKIEIKYDSIEKIQNTDIISTVLNADNTTQLFDKDFNLICTMNDATIESNDNFVKIYNATETKYFDKEGKEKAYKEIEPNNKLYAKKLENGKWTFEDLSGNVVENEYDKVTEFNEYGFAGIKKEGKWGVIDENGKVILEPVYEFQNNYEPDFIGKFYKTEYGFGEFYYTDKI